MKKIFFVISFLIISSTITAQTFNKDTVHFNFGSGIGWSYHLDKKVYCDLWSLPAFVGTIERGFFDLDSMISFSAGVTVAYKYLENKKTNTIATWNNFLIGATGRLYFNHFSKSKFIPYGGLFGGINAIKFRDNFYSNSNGYPTDYNGIYPIAYIFAGVKYISKPHFGVYGEVSYGFTYFTLGLYKVL